MTKIRITPDYETLRALLGGEEEAVVELRQSIAEEFARKHLKGLLNSEVMQRAIRDLEGRFAQVNQEIDARITRQIGEQVGNSWNGYTFKPSAKVAEAVRDTVDARFTIELNAQVDAIVIRRIAELQFTIERMVRAEVNRKVEKTIQDMVDTEVKRRLSAALTA